MTLIPPQQMPPISLRLMIFFHHSRLLEVYELPEDDDAWEEEDETVTQFSTSELYEFCVVPTLSDSVRHLSNLLLWSLIFTLTTRIVHPPAWLVHLISTACGCVVAWQLFGPRVLFMMYLILVGTLALFCSDRLLHSRRGPWTCASCVVFLILCELWWADPVEWHSIRGAQMIILMKIVSIGFDLDASVLSSHPSLVEMAGYIMNPGTVIFGPWISLDSYRKVLQPLSINLMLIANIVSKLVASAIYLLFSTCFVSWLVPDNLSRWMMAYRKALSFRSSHYFVSYFSEALALLAGLEVGAVAKPAFIEIPRSLVEVVIYWNMPMHHWLKMYIFKTARNRFGIFGALLFTYIMSSLFHGLNFQLAAVLLSLGFYTYVEYSLRQKLASVFDACILARRCSENCGHAQKGKSGFSVLVNLGFGFLTIFHLAYLGIMFDSPSQKQEAGYSMKHTLSMWSSLHYASHWIIFLFYIMSSVI
ncbi:protein-serine O-palmitoleoyltransferase porcupine-like [Macrobrachium nipponense]|uniref:protein-serine O-palmitoleoyltransferase porcupine-like n=1 Tax=Macrobrachium nipponense TaxID=159736 RepID=UPI0030C8D234